MKGSKNMSWVNLDDVYVNKSGDTIAGDLSVNGTLKVNDGKGTNTTYNVANEITTLRDSVSQVNKLYSSNTYAIAVISGCVCIHIYNLVLEGSSWATTVCPYTLPKQYCPSTRLLAPVVVANGGSTTGYIQVGTDGIIKFGNYGSNGSSDSRFGFLMYPIGIQHSVSRAIKQPKDTTVDSIGIPIMGKSGSHYFQFNWENDIHFVLYIDGIKIGNLFQHSVSQRGVINLTTKLNDNVVQVKFNSPINTDYVVATAIQFPKLETWGWPSVVAMIYNKTSTGFTMDVWNANTTYPNINCYINWIAMPIQHSVSHDYIVEQGRSNIWFYRKWNSGLAEFWGGKQVSGTGSITAPAVDFPFALTSLLYKSASAIYASGSKAVFIASGSGASSNDCSTTGTYVILQDVKDTSSTQIASIEYNIKGLWKQQY